MMSRRWWAALATWPESDSLLSFSPKPVFEDIKTQAKCLRFPRIQKRSTPHSASTPPLRGIYIYRLYIWFYGLEVWIERLLNFHPHTVWYKNSCLSSMYLPKRTFGMGAVMRLGSDRRHLDKARKKTSPHKLLIISVLTCWRKISLDTSAPADIHWNSYWSLLVTRFLWLFEVTAEVFEVVSVSQ